MEKKKNGCKAFLISKNRILRSVVTLLLLVSFLFLDVVRVTAASTLEEEVSDNTQSGLNIDDDDFANGNLLYGQYYYMNGTQYAYSPVGYHSFANGAVDITEFTVSNSLNGSIDMGKTFDERLRFRLSDHTVMFGKGSNIDISVSNYMNMVTFYGSDSSVVEKTFNVDSIGGYYLYAFDINYSSVSLPVYNFSVTSNHNTLNFNFSVKDLPFDVYEIHFGFWYRPNEAYSGSNVYFDNASYSFVRDFGFNGGKVSFSETEYSATDEMLGAINDNLDDIWARLCAIYDMVEDGFSAIVTLFYDLIDFLDAEFDSLSQTIVSQAMETRNTVVAQFTNLTNNLSSWFSNLTGTITTQFTNLTTNLRTWYNGLTTTLNNNFQSLLNQNAEEHEETINGYDDTVGSGKNEEVSGSINDFNTSQGEIMNDMNENMDDFTLPSDGLIGYAMQFTATFPLVASMMQSVFDSSGQFGLILSVIFAMTIFAMIVGMYKYYND